MARGLARLHAAGDLDRAGEQQQLLRQRGLARVGVGDDGEGAAAADFGGDVGHGAIIAGTACTPLDASRRYPVGERMRLGRPGAHACPNCPTSRSTSRASPPVRGDALQRVRSPAPSCCAPRCRRSRAPRGARVRRRRAPRQARGDRAGRRALPRAAPDDRRPPALACRRAPSRRPGPRWRAFDFDGGTLVLTEAGTQRRASLHLVQGRAALAALDPGGIDVMTCTCGRVRRALRGREPHAQALADQPAAVQRHRQRLLGRDPAPRAAVAGDADAQRSTPMPRSACSMPRAPC